MFPNPSPFDMLDMEETINIQQERFFRPSEKRRERGRERFQTFLKKAIRASFRLLIVALALFIGHWIYLHLLEDPLFRMREIKVEGCRRISQETVLALTQVRGMPNLFTISLREFANPLESHPWIEHVGVRKVFPNKILVQVEERKPIAILQLEELYYIDNQGVIFSPVGDRDEHDYPFLTGLTRQFLERDPEKAKGLMMKGLELLMVAEKEKAPFLQEISEIQMEKDYGIKCFTRTEGVEVEMGWDHFEEKLKRLSFIWLDLEKRGYSAALIDCSDLKRMVVKRR